MRISDWSSDVCSSDLQHVDGIDVGGGADLRYHDEVEPVAGALDHLDHVAVHVMGVQPVDTHRHGLGAPVDVMQRLDDVLARLRLVVGRHGILEIEEDHVGGGFRRLLEQLDAARSEEHTSELQSLMRISYAVFCFKKKNKNYNLKIHI